MSLILDFVALAVLLGGAIGVRNTLEPVHNADEIHAVAELFSFTGNIS